MFIDNVRHDVNALRLRTDGDIVTLPAHELENAVIQALIEFLRKDTAILTLLDERSITDDAYQVHAILSRAHRLAKQLEAPESITAEHAALTGHPMLIQLLQALVQKIIVSVDHLQISVCLNLVLHERDRLNEGKGGISRGR